MKNYKEHIHMHFLFRVYRDFCTSLYMLFEEMQNNWRVAERMMGTNKDRTQDPYCSINS
jgi:hypothetical protein